MPEPTPIRSAPAADARRRELLFALRVANVPNATADTVVNQHLCDDFYGYVHFLCTEKWKDGGAGGTPVTERITTSVYFRGEWASRPGIETIFLTFPPNHSMFLPELLRAHTHPHLQIGMTVGFGNYWDSVTFGPELLQLCVRTDYDQRLVSSPNFDERVIISKAEYLAGGW
jgi:hypothetical protein